MMELYHGTSESRLKSIFQHGIKPRGEEKGNWARTVESNPGFVYLTNAYALHFADNSTHKICDKLAVLQIDTNQLDQFNLAPDEDFLEQITRNDSGALLAPIGKSIRFRTRWYRNRLLSFRFYWRNSLAHMGTAAHYGTIPAAAITKVALIDQDTYTKMIIHLGFDPSISTINYRIMGAKYRNSINKLFGLELEYDPADQTQEQTLRQLTPQHIEEIKANEQKIWDAVELRDPNSFR